MHGFEAVADVRQAARHNSAEGVGEVALAEGVLEAGTLDGAG